jgi:hypothetical protein
MSPTALVESIYADYLRAVLDIPVYTGQSATQLIQKDSFVVVSCDECRRLAGHFFQATLAILLRTHALDQGTSDHSSSWSMISSALEAPPADPAIRGHFRSDTTKDIDENFLTTRENLIVGFAEGD